jgi:hypothetical protein
MFITSTAKQTELAQGNKASYSALNLSSRGIAVHL